MSELEIRQQNVSAVQKRNTMESLMGPKFAKTAVVLNLLQLKIAPSGRWRRFHAFALRNASLYQKPDSWLRGRLRPSVHRYRHRIPVLLIKHVSSLLPAKLISAGSLGVFRHPYFCFQQLFSIPERTLAATADPAVQSEFPSN